MESMKEKGIKFKSTGLKPDAKFSKIHTETISIEGLSESELIQVFDTIYNNKDLQEILEKLQMIYDEIVSKVE